MDSGIGLGNEKKVRKMKVKLRFSDEVTSTDPVKRNVMIIGQLPHLNAVPWDSVSNKLKPRVEEQLYARALKTLGTNNGSSSVCSLFFNSAVLASLPSKCSRHNTPSQSHAVTKLLKNSVAGDQLDVVLICERRDVFATACAVARAYPLFSRKTSSLGVDSVAANETQVRVEYVLVGGGGEKTSLAKADFECLDEIAECVQLAARIVDTPCSEMNTMHFLKEIEKVADATKAKLTVIKGDELRDKGFGGIYSVGRAAEVPPVLAVLSHAPPGASTTIAWVGKGIVYDTGGLSIKSKTGMPGMKRDCGGAAAVLGAFKAAVRRGFTENLHAVFCLAENAVGPRSTKPDDIITLYSGK